MMYIMYDVFILYLVLRMSIFSVFIGGVLKISGGGENITDVFVSIQT